MTARTLGIVAVVLVALLGHGGCATQSGRVGEIDAGESPTFGPYSSGDSGPGDSGMGACPEVKCPSGRTTCPNSRFPCDVDLSSDNNNCGACGNYCPGKAELGLALGMSTTCVDGVCQPVCERRENCNGDWDDGCEVDTDSDKHNCGGCGIECSYNESCGKIGTQGVCICDIPHSCGECGRLCPPRPPDLPTYPAWWHADYLECNQLTAKCWDRSCGVTKAPPPSNALTRWADCDYDFLGVQIPDPDGNGCETNITSDPNNCGGCGIKCGPGEMCQAGIDLIGHCVCLCGRDCQKFKEDPDNCGGCGIACRGADGDGHGRPICTSGVCGYRCDLNWADCDNDLTNGCETDLQNDPLNCGTCGRRCDGAPGQPCVNGQCLTKECPVQ
jgi:hypothetical protein